MTLRPKEDLSNWAKIIGEHYKIDWRAQSKFVDLVRMDADAKGRGFMEGVRILHHLMKDRAEDPQQEPRDVSKYLSGCCREAKEALGEPDIWEMGPSGTMQFKKEPRSSGSSSSRGRQEDPYSNPWAHYEPRDTGASSSSSSWGPEPKGQGKGDTGKGKGKGKKVNLIQGYR